MSVVIPRLACLFAASWLATACASRSPGEGNTGSPTSVIDVLTLFVEALQGERYEQALQHLSLSERARFDAVGGAKSPYIQRQLKALRLSTLANRPTVKLNARGLLEGIFDQLPELPYSGEGPAPTPAMRSDSAGRATDTASNAASPLPDFP